MAASSAGAGTPGAKTLSNGVGSLHAQKPTVDVGRSYPGPPCVFQSRHEPSPEAVVDVNAAGTLVLNVQFCSAAKALPAAAQGSIVKGAFTAEDDIVAHSPPSALVTLLGSTRKA